MQVPLGGRLPSTFFSFFQTVSAGNAKRASDRFSAKTVFFLSIRSLLTVHANQRELPFFVARARARALLSAPLKEEQEEETPLLQAREREKSLYRIAFLEEETSEEEV